VYFDAAFEFAVEGDKLLASFPPAFFHPHFITAENIDNVCNDFFVLLITISQYLNEFVDQVLPNCYAFSSLGPIQKKGL
jgi:hypothetical protein